MVLPRGAPQCESTGRCFVQGTLLRLFSGVYQSIERIEVGTIVCGGSGQALRVMQMRSVAAGAELLVELQVVDGGAALHVTGSHRVLTEGIDSVPRPVAAADLRIGDHILISGGDHVTVSPLTVARDWQAAPGTIVYEIVFDRNEPVAAFAEPPVQILSLGRAAHRSGSTRRGGQNRRGRNRMAGLPEESIPGTHDSWT